MFLFLIIESPTAFYYFLALMSKQYLYTPLSNKFNVNVYSFKRERTDYSV